MPWLHFRMQGRIMENEGPESQNKHVRDMRLQVHQPKCSLCNIIRVLASVTRPVLLCLPCSAPPSPASRASSGSGMMSAASSGLRLQCLLLRGCRRCHEWRCRDAPILSARSCLIQTWSLAAFAASVAAREGEITVVDASTNLLRWKERARPSMMWR